MRPPELPHNRDDDALRARALVVDAHSHLFPTAWEGGGHMPPDMFNISALLERQQASGVDVSTISDPHIWYGDLDVTSIDRTREYNDWVATLARDHPDKIVGLGSVTPWLGASHVAEAERAIRELRLPGLAIATSDHGRYLDSIPESFWELVEAFDIPLFIHPGGTVVGQEAMEAYRLGEVCGRPLDTTLSLSRLILTGTFERHRNVRMLCAHAGGAICAIADRLDFGHELRGYKPLGPWGPVELSEPPTTFVRRLYLDTVTYGVKPLRLAVDTVGPANVCYGSDNPPVPFALSRTMGIVRSLGLDAAATNQILGGNAFNLWRLGDTGGAPTGKGQ